MGALKVHPLKIVLLLLCVAVNWATSTQNQLINVDKDESKNYYRDGNLEPSFEVEPLKEGIRPAALVLRITPTVISTFTSTITCTTSTAPLPACPIGRRQSLESDGFLYNENEENRDDGGRILPTTGKPALIPEPDFPSIARYPPYPPSASGSSSIPSPDVVSRPELPPQPPVAPVIAEPSPMTYGPATPSTRPPRPPYPTPYSLPPFAETSRPLTPSPTQASSSRPYPPTVPVVAAPFPKPPIPMGPSPPRPVNPSSLPPLPETVPTVAEAPQLTHWKSDIRLPPAAQHSIPLYQPSAFEYPSASQLALSGIVEPSWLNDRDGLIQGRLGLMRLVAFGTSTVTSFSIKTTTVSITAVCSRTTGFSTCG